MPPLSGSILVAGAMKATGSWQGDPAGFTRMRTVDAGSGRSLVCWSKISDGTETSITIPGPTSSFSGLYTEIEVQHGGVNWDVGVSSAFVSSGIALEVGGLADAADSGVLALWGAVPNASFSSDPPGMDRLATTTRMVAQWGTQASIERMELVQAWTPERTGCGVVITVQPSLALIDPRNYGARCDGSADDTAAFQAAIDAAAASRATATVLVPGVIGISDRISVPSRVNVRGFGGGVTATNSYGSATILALGTDAQLAFLGGRAGISGGFNLVGAGRSDRADGLLYIGPGSSRSFDCIAVTDCIGTAMVVHGLQNSTLSAINIARCGADGGGNGFEVVDTAACVFSSIELRRIGGCHVLVREDSGICQNNTFIGVIAEEGNGSPGPVQPADAILRVDDGTDNLFIHCQFVGSASIRPNGGEDPDAIVQLNDGDTVFVNCKFNGKHNGNPLVRISRPGESLGAGYFTGLQRFQNAEEGVIYNGGGFYLDKIQSNVTNTISSLGTGDPNAVSMNRYRLPIVSDRDIRVIDSGRGVVLRSRPGNVFYRLTVDDAGVLGTEPA